jgi:TRAP-type uncharacterized transport system fused permease subunit
MPPTAQAAVAAAAAAVIAAAKKSKDANPKSKNRLRKSIIMTKTTTKDLILARHGSTRDTVGLSNEKNPFPITKRGITRIHVIGRTKKAVAVAVAAVAVAVKRTSNQDHKMRKPQIYLSYLSS